MYGGPIQRYMWSKKENTIYASKKKTIRGSPFFMGQIWEEWDVGALFFFNWSQSILCSLWKEKGWKVEEYGFVLLSLTTLLWLLIWNILSLYFLLAWLQLPYQFFSLHID